MEPRTALKLVPHSDWRWAPPSAARLEFLKETLMDPLMDPQTDPRLVLMWVPLLAEHWELLMAKQTVQ